MHTSLSGAYRHRNTIFYVFCFILCVVVARVQEIFPFLSALRLGALSAIFGVIILLSSGRLQYVLRLKETWLLTALWLLAALTIPFSVWPGGSFVFCAKALTSLLIFYLVIACYSMDLDNCMSLARGIALCGLLLCIEIIFLCAPAISGRIKTGGALDPNDLALILVCIFPFVLTLFQTGRKLEKAWSASLAVLFFAAIFITGSRGGIIGLFFVVLASMLGQRTKLRTKALIVGLCLVSLFFLPGSLITRFDAVWNGTDYNYSVGRIELWKKSAWLFLPHILTGVGAGQSDTAMGFAYGPTAWRATHNIFLQVGLELGMPGLLLFTAILYSIWKNIRTGLSAVDPDRHSPLRILLMNSRISLLGFLVCGLFLSQAYSPIVPFLLALTSNLAFIARRSGTGRKKPYRRSHLKIKQNGT